MHIRGWERLRWTSEEYCASRHHGWISRSCCLRMHRRTLLRTPPRTLSRTAPRTLPRIAAHLSRYTVAGSPGRASSFHWPPQADVPSPSPSIHTVSAGGPGASGKASAAMRPWPNPMRDGVFGRVVADPSCCDGSMSMPLTIGGLLLDCRSQCRQCRIAQSGERAARRRQQEGFAPIHLQRPAGLLLYGLHIPFGDVGPVHSGQCRNG